MAKVVIPALLRHLSGGAEELYIDIPAGERQSVRQVMERLSEAHPGLLDGMLHHGDLMPSIAVFVDNEQAMMGLQTKVSDESEIRFLPPVVGGR